MDRDKLLEAEIVSGKRATNVYADLSKGMTFYQIKKQTEIALEVDNMPAVQGLAMSNHFAVADTLSSTRGYKMIARKASSGDSSAPELFFMLRGTLNETYRPIFKRLAKQCILKVSQGITGQGLRGRMMERTEYVPGMEFNIEETIERYIETGSQYLSYEDIVGLRRAEKTKTGVLMFDTSGSLFGKRFTNAALAIAILAYHLSQDNYSVVLFNTKAYVIQSKRVAIIKDFAEHYENMTDEKAFTVRLYGKAKKTFSELHEKYKEDIPKISLNEAINKILREEVEA